MAGLDELWFLLLREDCQVVLVLSFLVQTVQLGFGVCHQDLRLFLDNYGKIHRLAGHMLWIADESPEGYRGLWLLSLIPLAL